MDTNYQVEPELRTSVRQAFWTSEARTLRKVVWGLVLAILLIGGFFAYRDLSGLYALLRQGKTVAARVTGKQEIHGKSTTYQLDYYFDGGGERVYDTAHVSQFLYESTPVGDALQVTYLPSNPSVHRLGDIDASRVTKHEINWGVGIGGIAGFFALLMMAAEYSYRQQMRLAVSGVPVVGKIVSCEPPTPGSKITTYTVKYTFVDLRGDTKKLCLECARSAWKAIAAGRGRNRTLRYRQPEPL